MQIRKEPSSIDQHQTTHALAHHQKVAILVLLAGEESLKAIEQPCTQNYILAHAGMQASTTHEQVHTSPRTQSPPAWPPALT